MAACTVAGADYSWGAALGGSVTGPEGPEGNEAMTCCNQCGKPADRIVRYRHPSPKLQWSAPFCKPCAAVLESKRGVGVFLYQRIDAGELVEANANNEEFRGDGRMR